MPSPAAAAAACPEASRCSIVPSIILLRLPPQGDPPQQAGGCLEAWSGLRLGLLLAARLGRLLHRRPRGFASWGDAPGA